MIKKIFRKDKQDKPSEEEKTAPEKKKSLFGRNKDKSTTPLEMLVSVSPLAGLANATSLLTDKKPTQQTFTTDQKPP